MLHFAYPLWLFALTTLPLVALLLLQHVTRERRDLEDYAQRGALAKMGIKLATERRLVRAVLVLLALASGIVALAEPRWGDVANDTATTQEGSLVVVLDVSRSMLAQDMGGESRLATAQRLVTKLLPSLAGWKIGVVGFAGEGQALVPLTTDHDAVETMLQRAQPGSVSGKGTNLEAGLKAALPLFNRPGRRVALVMSDGEELSGDATQQAGALREAKVEVDAVGLGTPDGGYIPGPPDVWGNPTYLTYRGEKVTSRLNEVPLRTLANTTGGFYLRAVEGEAAALANRLGAVGVRDAQAPVSSGEHQGFELFQVPLALALFLVLADAALGLWARPRTRRRFADDLRAAMHRPAVAMLLFAIVATQSGWTWYPSWLPNREAGQAFASSDYGRAAALLDAALKHDPDNFGLQYNRANVAYEQKQYSAAIAGYRRAIAVADPAARPVIAYNLGNAYFRQAEATKDPAGYKQAITEYERVLAARPTDKDAKDNLELAKRRLKNPHQRNNKPQKGQGGGQNQQGQKGSGMSPGANAVGANPTYHPPAAPRNLPSEAEVDALLKALESDERQRQAEQGAERPDDPNGSTYTQQLLNQALGTLDLQKDW